MERKKWWRDVPISTLACRCMGQSRAKWYRSHSHTCPPCARNELVIFAAPNAAVDFADKNSPPGSDSSSERRAASTCIKKPCEGLAGEIARMSHRFQDAAKTLTRLAARLLRVHGDSASLALCQHTVWETQDG